MLVFGVALRKESVDRNGVLLGCIKEVLPSLSARRAWIEILNGATLRLWACVALRKESVDRNNIDAYALYEDVKSLSARRAWIEIVQLCQDCRR